MGKFSHHEACPQCGSKDNLGVWEDGHKWCFGCKYYEKGTFDLKTIHVNIPEIAPNNKHFPDDAQHYIPYEPMKWLLNCGIGYSEARRWNIQWSPKQKLVCWEIGNSCWQGRVFDKESKKKYVSSGKIHEVPTLLYGPRGTRDTVVLVEDYISSIRVSDHLCCMPLFGCTIGLETLQGLTKTFKKVIVWLDADKLDNARKICLNANMVGLDCRVLFTPKDPKEYTNDEIEQFLGVFNDK